MGSHCGIQGLFTARWPQVALPRPDSQECTFRVFGLQQHRAIFIIFVFCGFLYKARVGEGRQLADTLVFSPDVC
jgi:hypothetical protein